MMILSYFENRLSLENTVKTINFFLSKNHIFATQKNKT